MRLANIRHGMWNLGWVFSILFISPPVHAEETSKPPSVEERLEQLEKSQEELFHQITDKSSQVKPFLNDDLSFGGFLDTGVVGIWGPNTKTQASASSHFMGLNVAAKFTETLRFNSQLMASLSFPLQNPNNSGAASTVSVLRLPATREFGSTTISILVAQGYAEYSETRAFVVQMGLGYVPFGIAYQQREPVLFRRRGGPQLLGANGDDGVGMVSPLWMGLHISGTLDGLGNRWGYNAYTFTPASNTKSLGVGARTWWSPVDNLSLGVSMQQGKRSGIQEYTAYGADARWSVGRFAVTAEAALQSVSKTDPWTAYIEPEFSFFDGVLLIYAALDYFDNTIGIVNNGAARLPDPYRQFRYGGGINFLPHPYTRFRLGLLKYDYTGPTAISGTQNRDFVGLDASVGVAF